MKRIETLVLQRRLRLQFKYGLRVIECLCSRFCSRQVASSFNVASVDLFPFSHLCTVCFRPLLQNLELTLAHLFSFFLKICQIFFTMSHLQFCSFFFQNFLGFLVLLSQFLSSSTHNSLPYRFSRKKKDCVREGKDMNHTVPYINRSNVGVGQGTHFRIDSPDFAPAPTATHKFLSDQSVFGNATFRRDRQCVSILSFLPINRSRGYWFGQRRALKNNSNWRNVRRLFCTTSVGVSLASAYSLAHFRPVDSRWSSVIMKFHPRRSDAFATVDRRGCHLFLFTVHNRRTLPPLPLFSCTFRNSETVWTISTVKLKPNTLFEISSISIDSSTCRSTRCS